jgi:hypothetical protein
MSLRILLLVCLVSIVLALGALEVVASHLASEELSGRETLPASAWLAR